jgi:outer membrane protein assembly factor BamE (lipoprotein component of BamABCDE complex)
MTAAEHESSLPSSQAEEMTVGVVQKEIRVGMSGADIAEALGSPNIVTKDSAGNETWVYDKIASEVSYSKDSGGTGLIINLFGGYNREAGAVSTTQKTLTVVIKYDAKGLVESFSYHASKF